MSKMMEDMRNEVVNEAVLDNTKEIAKRMIEKGKMSLEEIAEYIPLSLDELQQLKAIIETIRICKGKNILKDYLEEREKEVVSIMLNSYAEERTMKSFIKSERHDADRETAARLIKMGKLSLEEIALCVPSIQSDELKEIETEVMQN